MIIAAILVVGALAAAGLKILLSLPPSVSTPLAQSVRVGNDIVTLIQSLEGYVPSLHRNPDQDRYRVGLLVTPVDDPSHARLIPIAKGLEVGDLRLAHVLGFDGIHVWCALDQIQGVNLKTGEIVDAATLRDANPSLDETWDDLRRISCGKRLRITSPDWKQFSEVDPETLKATAAHGERGPALPVFGVPLDGFLSADARPSPTTWLALLSPKDARIHYKVKSSLDPINRVETAKELRQFYRGSLGPEEARGSRSIRSLTPVPGDEYLDAALMRSGLDAEPTRLSGPDSFLILYTASPALGATLVVARVNTEGKIIWKADTGLERFSLKQILPDERFPAFVGTKPPVPGKVPEPLLVIIDNQTGIVLPCSLCR